MPSTYTTKDGQVHKYYYYEKKTVKAKAGRPVGSIKKILEEKPVEEKRGRGRPRKPVVEKPAEEVKPRKVNKHLKQAQETNQVEEQTKINKILNILNTATDIETARKKILKIVPTNIINRDEPKQTHIADIKKLLSALLIEDEKAKATNSDDEYNEDDNAEDDITENSEYNDEDFESSEEIWQREQHEDNIAESN